MKFVHCYYVALAGHYVPPPSSEVRDWSKAGCIAAAGLAFFCTFAPGLPPDDYCPTFLRPERAPVVLVLSGSFEWPGNALPAQK